MELQKNDIYTDRCVGYTSEALGIVRLDGRAVFVKGLIRGERAEIRIVKTGKRAVYGKIERLLEASPERISPDCAVYGKCGGCALRHMSYREELEFKKKRVEDAFLHIGGIELKVDEILGAKEINGYRNKTIYTVGRDENGAVTGFYRARSHELIPTDRCLIESDYGNRCADAVKAWIDRYNIPIFDSESGQGVRRLMCRWGEKSGEGQVVLVTGKGEIPHKKELVEKILEICPETVSIMGNVNPAPGDTVLSREFYTIWGQDYIMDSLCGMEFRLAPGAFYQINHNQAERLYEKAIEYAALTGREKVLDLYCGTGTITLRLAMEAKEAVGAEIVESAVKNAGENAERNGVGNVRFICGDAGETARTLREKGYNPEVVVVDPPRKGLLPEVSGIIASMEPQRVVYVSCDPGTLARDLKLFKELGYDPQKATAVDMFPRTSHVETVVLLSRQESSETV